MKRTFRLGSTSYVYPDDILPNVGKLATVVDDIELVLFKADDYGTNPTGTFSLPDASTITFLSSKQVVMEWENDSR